MLGARRRVKELGAHSATRLLALVAASLVVSSCATYRPPPTNQTMTEARRATCDDFARGEVKRLGESVPRALARGFVDRTGARRGVGSGERSRATQRDVARAFAGCPHPSPRAPSRSGGPLFVGHGWIPARTGCRPNERRRV